MGFFNNSFSEDLVYTNSLNSKGITYIAKWIYIIL